VFSQDWVALVHPDPSDIGLDAVIISEDDKLFSSTVQPPISPFLANKPSLDEIFTYSSVVCIPFVPAIIFSVYIVPF
jgi:hypothetical protein